MNGEGPLTGELRLKRLRWLARRGMRELEILIENFLEREAETLAAGEWPQLESFLDSEDDVLWDWVQGRAAPAEAFDRALVSALCQELR